MNTYKHFFVEGNIDSLFLTNLFIEKLSILDENISIIEYAKQKNSKINNYIKSIKQTPNMDYIFLSDQDGDKDKISKVLKQYKNLDSDKVFIVIYEIESWIIAGISEKLIKKYKIKPIPNDTAEFTKEKFDQLIPERLDKTDFICQILEDYNLQQALTRSASLKLLYDYIKKAS